jgi:hypothetical protein
MTLYSLPVAGVFSRRHGGGIAVRSLDVFDRFAQSNGNSSLPTCSGFIKHARTWGSRPGQYLDRTVWLKLHNENLLDRMVSDQLTEIAQLS